MAQHGLESDRQHVLLEAEMFNRNGYGVLMTTFRAHDLSDDEIFTWGVKEMMDFQAWYDYLLTRGDVDPEKIGIYGESIGGALTIKFVSKEKPNIKAVITHSAFSSIGDAVEMGVKYYAGLPAFPFAPMIVWWAERTGGFDASEINTKDWVADMCGTPILILQGGADDHIPAESGQWIHDAACAPKKLWFEGGEECIHTGLDEPECVDPQVYETRLCKFYDCHLLGDGAACSEMDTW
jgi:esterase/lipase